MPQDEYFNDSQLATQHITLQQACNFKQQGTQQHSKMMPCCAWPQIDVVVVLPQVDIVVLLPQVDIVAVLGGSDSQRLLALDLRLTKSAGKVMVTDAKGRLQYINNDLREMLGYSSAVSALR